MEKWESSFKTRTDLAAYDDTALGLFALQLRFSIDDIDSVAADSITGGNDDKKCDLIYINKDEGFAVICQCYIASKMKKSAPSNKASDLNTGIGWLLQRSLQDLPLGLQSSAKELRDAINDGNVTEIHIWYVHNLPESKNCKQELITVEATADSILKTDFANKHINVRALEVGRSKIEEWYLDTQSPIIVNDKFDLMLTDGYEVKSKRWKAYMTTLPAKFLHTVFKKYKAKLFSANIRDYLGSRNSDANINNGIKRTAENEPQNFWVFNNGLTILTHSYEPEKVKNKIKLSFHGMSIVNGAQTTGAIGSLAKSPDPAAMVPIRFVCTTNADIIYDIIQYNNSQNKVTASDFRSRDNIQKRLRDEITKIPDAEYQGGRRGSHVDVIKRNPKILPSYTVGQALAAFHQDPVVAYNQKSNIWVSDKLYSKYFNDETTGAHIVFAYSLLRSVEAKKVLLIDKSRRAGSLTASEQRQLDFLRHRGSTYLLSSAVASCLETFIKRRVPNMHRLSFGSMMSPVKGQEVWTPIIEAIAPFCSHLEEAFTYGLQNTERVNKAIQTFQSLVEATAGANKDKYRVFAAKVSTRSK